MGGRLALSFAHRYPDATSEVVAISSHVGLEKTKRLERQKFEAYWLKKLSTLSVDQFLDLWYSQPLFATLKRSSHFQAMLERRRVVDFDHQAALFERYRLSSQPNLWPHLSEMPVQFIYGSEDERYRPMHKRLIKQGIKSTLIGGAGHAIHLENPEELWIKLQP